MAFVGSSATLDLSSQSPARTREPAMQNALSRAHPTNSVEKRDRDRIGDLRVTTSHRTTQQNDSRRQVRSSSERRRVRVLDSAAFGVTTSAGSSRLHLRGVVRTGGHRFDGARPYAMPRRVDWPTTWPAW